MPRTTAARRAAERRRRLRRSATVAALALVTVGAGVVVAVRDGAVPAVSARCTAGAGGNEHTLTADRAAVAALITARARARGLPPRAATIAIATAVQESGLRNLAHGDRDSLGLFQQRPSQGWGTPEQVQDPLYATDAFYDGLVEVEGYEGLDVTVAAQEVQRSGFPTAYADHEPEARVLASALTGYSPAALVCRLPEVEPTGEPQVPGDEGLLPRARVVVEEAAAQLGEGGLTPAGDPGAAPAGAVLERVYGEDEAGVRDGWALAHWAVARAVGTDVVAVATDGRRWSRGEAAWVEDTTAPGPGAVRVTVAG
ncbi:hypothetical protein [uncultured Pseudokineococcus sp.]|uniref:hypothetical protein n=1 Tax=uncultured Pseudokineococcus sp. TaxID=1642928 RepID=UPI002636D24B|nr:hypothetical protein [uncultured Pseudokineococcus sp.]